jgi:hypothetical protein
VIKDIRAVSFSFPSVATVAVNKLQTYGHDFDPRCALNDLDAAGESRNVTASSHCWQRNRTGLPSGSWPRCQTAEQPPVNLDLIG